MIEMEAETVMFEASIVDWSGDERSSNEDELTEVTEELEVLKADNVYHEFVSDVLYDKPIPEDEATDPDFIIKEEGDLCSKMAEVDEDSSSSSDESIYEETIEDIEVKVPAALLKEAATRYPPFWKVNDKLHRDTNSGYKSDEDPDYKFPFKCDKCNTQSNDNVTKECGDCHKDLDDKESTTSGSSNEDNDEDVANLVEMVEEMALPGIESQQDDDQVERNLVRSIIEFDDADYNSDEDPDFVAPIDVDNDEGSSAADDESSSSDESDEMVD